MATINARNPGTDPARVQYSLTPGAPHRTRSGKAAKTFGDAGPKQDASAAEVVDKLPP